MAADKSHLYAAAGLPVNTYVPSGQVNPHGSALNFSNAAGTNIFTGPHVGELGSAMNLSGTNTTVPIANPHMGEEKIGTYSTGIYTPTAAQIRNQANTDKYPLNDYSADYRFGQEAIANYTEPNRTPTTNPSGGSIGRAVAGTSIPQVVLNQMDLSQRTPSGSMYAPDLSAYNDSSLFNYTGPGGVNEYTYGQNLPYQGAGYDIWGSPTDVPNPYFWGQFGEEPVAAEAQGPADGAIGLPPVDLPAGVAATNNNPNVGTNTTNITTGGGTGPGGQDLTYAQTLAEMGINPADAPSTTFPSPGDNIAPVVNPGLTLTERQLAEMSPEQIARMNQILADEARMQQGQLGSGFKGEEELNKDVQKAIFDSYRNEDGNIFDTYRNEDGTIEEDLLARQVAAGMAENQRELQAKGQILQDKFDAQEAIVPINQHFLRNQAEYTPSIRDYYPGATPMQLHQGEVLNAIKEGPKTGPGGLTTADLEPSIFDYSADDRFRQTPQSIADVDYDARPLNRANAAATANTTGYENIYGTPLDFRSAAEKAITSGAVNTQHPAYQAMLDRQINEAENAFQMQGTGGLPNKGSYAGSSAGLDGDVLNTQHPAYAAHQNRLENLFQTQGIEGLPNKGSYAGSSANLGGGTETEGGKKGPSGKDATEASRINDLQNIFGGDLGHLGHKLISDSSITDAALDKHYDDKWDTGYSDRDVQGFEPLSGNEYHIRSGIDYGKLSGDKNLNLGGIPSALAGFAYQQADDFGKEGLLQAVDNARGLALSGNAPAVKSIFDAVDAITSAPAKHKEQKAKIEKEKSEGTFKPRVVAENKAKVAAEAKAKKVEAEAKRKKGLAEAAAEKAKKAAAAKKKREEEAARNARENARRPTPAPKPKPKPKKTGPSGKTATTVKKASTSKGGRGSRGKRTKPSTSFNRWGKRYGGR